MYEFHYARLLCNFVPSRAQAVHRGGLGRRQTHLVTSRLAVTSPGPLSRCFAINTCSAHKIRDGRGIVIDCPQSVRPRRRRPRPFACLLRPMKSVNLTRGEKGGRRPPPLGVHLAS
ncbi:hypothetical protein EVAR_60211_1 [Eumeta japonica]|uniref:Uncharacterized protein n=1 Tax=Eumeta variegata TaxID=151549 RepID=A0A4C1ZCB5_EUMVA|nr:hypothetical protein EVAR_60211_1 [Eumeta japonica]